MRDKVISHLASLGKIIGAFSRLQKRQEVSWRFHSFLRVAQGEAIEDDAKSALLGCVKQAGFKFTKA